jgi:hypothetical protein
MLSDVAACRFPDLAATRHDYRGQEPCHCGGGGWLRLPHLARVAAAIGPESPASPHGSALVMNNLWAASGSAVISPAAPGCIFRHGARAAALPQFFMTQGRTDSEQSVTCVPVEVDTDKEQGAWLVLADWTSATSFSAGQHSTALQPPVRSTRAGAGCGRATAA